MIVSPLIQESTMDVTDWDQDEFVVFPQGARAKSAYISPDAPLDPVIRPRWRYLLKMSRGCYPEQFWGEVVAYRIACLMGVPVPPAFVAIHRSTGAAGALIEWFYEEGAQNFVWAGEFLQKINENFDRERGSTHCVQDNEILARSFAMGRVGRERLFTQDWRQWWVDALLFDALIGNTDRHQDNWGFVFRTSEPYISLAPLFDNGTSLGSERHQRKFVHWGEKDFAKYIENGKHHIRWRMASGVEEQGHVALVRLALARWPSTRTVAQSRLNFSAADMAQSIDDLAALDSPVPFGSERRSFMLELLTRRLAVLQDIVHDPATTYRRT